MCKVLEVSRSSYYKWLKGDISKRKLENQLLTDAIKKVFAESKQTYGSPRIVKELKRNGCKVSKPRVAKLMRLAGLRSKVKKKYKITTDSNHCYPVSKNHLNRAFNPDELNKIWVSDITYIRTSEGWLYLTTIIDLYDRQVIGWSMSKSLKTIETIIPAWNMAISKRNIIKPIIFHSDRGVQYACYEFRNHIEANKLITQSMSRKGNCWDNAAAESFFKTIKSELVYHEKYTTIKQAELSVFEYIEVWYNRKRLHSALGYRTPIEVENEFNKSNNVA
jgi:transposase InsO family protein